MVICYGIFTLRLEDSFSLKDKRMVTKSIIGKIKNRFNASCSETGFTDSHKDIEITAAVVSSSRTVAENEMMRIGDFIDMNSEAVLISEAVDTIRI